MGRQGDRATLPGDLQPEDLVVCDWPEWVTVPLVQAGHEPGADSQVTIARSSSWHFLQQQQEPRWAVELTALTQPEATRASKAQEPSAKPRRAVGLEAALRPSPAASQSQKPWVLPFRTPADFIHPVPPDSTSSAHHLLAQSCYCGGERAVPLGDGTRLIPLKPPLTLLLLCKCCIVNNDSAPQKHTAGISWWT